MNADPISPPTFECEQTRERCSGYFCRYTAAHLRRPAVGRMGAKPKSLLALQHILKKSQRPLVSRLTQ